KLAHWPAIGQAGKATPSVASSSGRKVSGGAKVKLARTRLSSQKPILPSRRRSAGNSRRRRGRQNSQSATATRLATITMRAKRASSRVPLLYHVKLVLRPPLLLLGERRALWRSPAVCKRRRKRCRQEHLTIGRHRRRRPDGGPQLGTRSVGVVG